MRLKMDTSTVRFMVTRAHEAKLDFETQQQKADQRTGAMLWQLQLIALDESGAEILTVVVDHEPKVSVGEFVHVEGLVASPWLRDGKADVSFRAASIAPLGKQQNAA